ncbi:hypothetical protein QBC32DRAFT_234080 [Pseudoneurospora amorphoporcata]|uniref:Dynamin N-terminal domain-containing protein n=1 Tax=Pseudoneurospora amorphoporcata TaxID=241081 RepID=A0AAN6NZ96_9PEZI|nr:hypothetical protein QBC32DRAFT_234080 [Pseudoneurospora amorphoporcata]
MDIPIKTEELSTAEEMSVVSDTSQTSSRNGKLLPFARDSCPREVLRSRVLVKQQAVEDAFGHAKTISESISLALVDKESESFKELFDKEIVAWIDELLYLEKKHKNFEVLVGVAGVTGAGKSTILNMLLEMPELLPSSNSEASTSSACRVSWNHDDNPQRSCSAVVIFRDRQDVQKELEELYEALNETERMENDDEEPEDNEAFEAELSEYEDTIKAGLQKILAVWGIEREEVTKLSAEELLESNHDVLSVLGTTKRLHAADPEKFAELIKPYLDSSATVEGYQAWPLVQEARVFVKADILKDGISLVDLPGLSDAVESRAKVSERYNRRIDTTMIVTPSSRAIDEKTAVQLMTDYQTLRMKLDGRLQKNRYCVVVSQMDHIDVDGFIKQSPAAKSKPHMQEDRQNIQALCSRLNILDRNIKECARRLDQLIARRDKVFSDRQALKAASQGSGKLKKSFDNLKKYQEKLQATYSKLVRARKAVTLEDGTQKSLLKERQNAQLTLDTTQGRVKWTCMLIRHLHIQKRLTENLERQRREIEGAIKGSESHGSFSNIFSLSAIAYRDLLKGRKSEGFPTKSYTGIPQLRQWLSDSILQKREVHLDGLLNALRRLLHGIQRWSNTKSERVTFSRESIEDVLSRSHDKYNQRLSAALHEWSRKIKRFDPFVQMDEGRKACKTKSRRVATRWAFKNPSDKTSCTLMAWTTFNAIIRRGGGPYTSNRSNPNKNERIGYNFPEALAVHFLEVVLKDWKNVFENRIPGAQEPIMKQVEDIWFQYLNELTVQLQDGCFDLLPHFEESVPTMRGIKDEIRSKVLETLTKLSRSSSQIHPHFRIVLQEELEPMFEKCLGITGIGHYQRRRRFLQDAVKAQSIGMFDKGFNKMRTEYDTHLAKVPQEFREIAEFAITKVREQIALLLTNLEAIGEEKKELSHNATNLRQEVGNEAVKWVLEWRVPKVDENPVRPHSYLLPGG